MDVLWMVVLGLAGIALLVGFALLVRREVRFRRLPSDGQRTPQEPRPSLPEADAYNAQIMRGAGTGGLV